MLKFECTCFKFDPYILTLRNKTWKWKNGYEIKTYGLDWGLIISILREKYFQNLLNTCYDIIDNNYFLTNILNCFHCKKNIFFCMLRNFLLLFYTNQFWSFCYIYFQEIECAQDPNYFYYFSSGDFQTICSTLFTLYKIDNVWQNLKYYHEWQVSTKSPA